MKIGVLEFMPKGHYTLVESVSKIFASDEKNEVIIYTTSIGCSNLHSITSEYSNISLVNIEEEYGVANFISKIGDLNLNRAYIITLDHYISQLKDVEFKYPIHLFIHNIYLWFDISFKSNFKRTLKEVANKPSIAHYWIKRNFFESRLKKKITKKVLESKGKFVVLNSNLTSELSRFTKKINIEEIPFSIYQPSIPDRSSKSQFRICVPGMLSTSRRDYFSLFKLMESNPDLYKNSVEVDLLGGVNKSEGGEIILNEAIRLKNLGYKIVYYNKPLVELEEFDFELSKATLILGNMHVVMNEFNIYGKSKESGIMYTMIKVAKPGLLPTGYNILPELKDSTLIFNSYENLGNIVRNLIDNKDKLDLLCNSAKKNSDYFRPELVYSRLIK